MQSNKGYHTPFWELLEKLDKKNYDEMIKFHEGFMAISRSDEDEGEKKEDKLAGERN